MKKLILVIGGIIALAVMYAPSSPRTITTSGGQQIKLEGAPSRSTVGMTPEQKFAVCMDEAPRLKVLNSGGQWVTPFTDGGARFCTVTSMEW